MNHISISLPIILYCYKILKDSEEVERYLKSPCGMIQVHTPLLFLMTLMVFHLSGFAWISHYQGSYEQVLSVLGGNFPLYRAEQLRSILAMVPGSMVTWKLFLLQRRLVEQYAPTLLEGKDGPVLDLDGMAMVSYSTMREGSNFGHSKRFRGKPLLQLSASFIGKIFVDGKLFPGCTNTATFFKKSIKRVISLGYTFTVVRADALYGNVKNLLFAEKLFLSYAIGISTHLKALKEGKQRFEQLARKKSSKIIHLKKGLAILDLGLVNVASEKEKTKVFRRVILCRRLHRRKKNGKWEVKRFYYAIVTSFTWTPRKVHRFYMRRQCIENGFKELRYHYHVNNFCKNGSNSLKANELWLASKMFAMTMFKIFGENMLPKRLRHKRRTTLLRELFDNTIFYVHDGKVELRRNPQHLWHLQRIFTKLEQDRFLSKPFRIGT